MRIGRREKAIDNEGEGKREIKGENGRREKGLKVYKEVQRLMCPLFGGSHIRRFIYGSYTGTVQCD